MGGSATRPPADPSRAVASAVADDPLLPGVAVAVSGGRDSVALLHCVARATRGTDIAVHALHVDHGLVPGSDAWPRALRPQCRRWGVTLHVERLAGGPAPGDSVEAWARRARYAALARMALASHCRVVLLAHHRQDQAETVLLQLQRGGGARGLAAMPVEVERKGIRWVRPWLARSRAAIEAYVARYRLQWVDDPSNDDERLARNRLRRRAHDLLVRHEAGFAAAARRAQEEAACLHALAGIDAASATEGGALRVMAWGLLEAPRRANLLRHWLRAHAGAGAPQTLIDRLQSELPRATQGRWSAPGGELRLHRGWLRYVPLAPSADPGDAPAAMEDAALDLSRPGHYPLGAGRGWIEVDAVDEGGIAVERLAQVCLRARRGGERFQGSPGRPARALKKQFQQHGVPAWERRGPLVVDAEGALLYVPGLGIDARAIAPAGEAQHTIRWRPGSPA